MSSKSAASKKPGLMMRLFSTERKSSLIQSADAAATDVSPPLLSPTDEKLRLRRQRLQRLHSMDAATFRDPARRSPTGAGLSPTSPGGGGPGLGGQKPRPSRSPTSPRTPTAPPASPKSPRPSSASAASSSSKPRHGSASSTSSRKQSLTSSSSETQSPVSPLQTTDLPGSPVGAAGGATRNSGQQDASDQKQLNTPAGGGGGTRKKKLASSTSLPADSAQSQLQQPRHQHQGAGRSPTSRRHSQTSARHTAAVAGPPAASTPTEPPPAAGRAKKLKHRKRVKKHVDNNAATKIDTSQPLEFPTTPEVILDYHRQKSLLNNNEEWLVVELNEYECLVDSIEILRIIAKHSKFFEVEPDELWEEFFEFVEDVPSYDEIINYDVWQEFRDIKYPC